MTDDKCILRIRNITKEFPGVIAVNRANLDIQPGKVHALVGGNGAGKSTLMKVLSGVYPYGTYDGEFILDGGVCEFESVIDAEHKGIAMVPQELNMADDMSVAENLFLNKFPNRKGLINTYNLYNLAQKIIDEFGIDASPTTKVREIGIAQKQLIVVARAIYSKMKVLILDEPTATLSDAETRFLFKKIRSLKKQDIACIYISHRLEDVRKLADTVTVMRDGKLIETDRIEKMSDQRIVTLMIGREINNFYPTSNRAPGDTVLSVNPISVYSTEIPDKKVVENIDFELRKGEILSIYGLVGSGRSEMALGMIGGWRGKVESSIELHGVQVSFNSPAEAVEAGIGYLPEDRKGQGVLSGQSIGINISASSLNIMSKGGYVNPKIEKTKQQEMFDALSVKANSIDTLIDVLSGGNQQKCILGRLIAADSQILILDEATQGVDVETKIQIYNILNNLCAEGKSVIFISSDLSEILGIADRIMVFYEGKVVNTIDAKRATRQQIIWNATMGKIIEGGDNSEQ